LHRIEEERHDYDFNVEANIKCIQLLEPIAQQMLVMPDAEKEHFRMPAALAGQTTSIFKRVCKKLYGETGIQVVNDLFGTPFSTVPVVLMRMKQKDEEWRFAQREWEKVWHQQTEHMHLRSLDHMGILVKQTDKRNFSAKHLVDVIKTKYEEQRRERSLNGKAPRHQAVWSFTDKDVILDLLRLMGLYAIHNSQHSNTEKERIWDFFVEFIPAFFELDEARVQDRVPKPQLDSGEEDGDDGIPAELTNGRSRRNGKKGDLLRGVLDPGRNGSKSRATKEGSASGSKETTPDVQSGNEDDVADAPEDEQALPDASNERWMPTIPKPTIVKAADDNDLLTADNELKADGFFSRPWYNFFCNQPIFVFFSVFETLYKRLKEVKEAEQCVANSILRIQRSRPSKEIGLTTELKNFFTESDSADTYWPKTLELIEDYITGEIDENRYQDILRHYYLANGWKLYTIQDLIRTLCRLALTCSSSDGKEKTNDLIKQFLQSREREETSYQTEISARKFAEKCIKDGEMFVICWVSSTRAFISLPSTTTRVSDLPTPFPMTLS
jgi:paired amphipathic helix protein Sin3a